MPYRVVVSPAARRDLKRLPDSILRRIGDAIDTLADNPRPQGSTKLQGEKLYRIRVSDYRIIYEIQDKRLIVLVVRIGHRRDVTVGRGDGG